MNRSASALVPAVALLGMAAPVSADPRFPAPVALVAAGAAPIVGLNVGLVTREPSGAGWGLSCPADQSADVIGYRQDPAQPNRILALLHLGLAITEDLGCTWRRFPLPPGVVIDAGFDRDRPGEIWSLRQVQGRVGVEFWGLSDLAVREVWRLPWAVDIENAELVGRGPERRLLVAAFDDAAPGPVLLESSPTGEPWQQHRIAEGTRERPRIVRAAAGSNELVVRLMGAVGDRLAMSADGRGFRVSELLDGYARAVWRSPEGQFLVALRDSAGNTLLDLDAGAGLLKSRRTAFAFRAMEGTPERILGLAYALGQSAPLLESHDLGITWSAAMDLRDVRIRAECVAANPRCVDGCYSLAGAGLVDARACELGSAPPTGAGFEGPDAAGGCVAAGGASEWRADWFLIIIAMGSWLGRRRT